MNENKDVIYSENTELFFKKIGGFKLIATKSMTVEPDETETYFIKIVCPDGTEFKDTIAYYNDTDYQKEKFKGYNNVVLDFRCLDTIGLEISYIKFYGTFFGVEDEIDNIIQDFDEEYYKFRYEFMQNILYTDEYLDELSEN